MQIFGKGLNNKDNKTDVQVAAKKASPTLKKSEKPSKIQFETRVLENKYFLDISRNFKIARYVVILILILFVLFMLSAYQSDITFENLKYLIKYFDINITDSSGEYSTLHYDADSKMDFTCFQEDFAVATPTDIVVYDQIGNVAVSGSISMSNPIIESSEKYLLIYDKGGTTYSIYNSFSELNTGTCEYPISMCAISDSGSYAVVSRNADYLSDVCVYDKNFNKTAEIQKDKYVVSVNFSLDGMYIMILSVYSDNTGLYTSEMMIYDLSKKESVVTETYTDKLALSAEFNSSGGLTILFSDCYMFYGSDFKMLSEYDFGEKSPSKFCIGENFSAIIFSENDIGYKNTLILLNNDGSTAGELSVSGQLSGIKISGEYFYILTENQLIRGKPGGDAVYCELSEKANDIEINDSGILLVCYSNKAVAEDFKNASEYKPEV